MHTISMTKICQCYKLPLPSEFNFFATLFSEIVSIFVALRVMYGICSLWRHLQIMNESIYYICHKLLACTHM